MLSRKPAEEDGIWQDREIRFDTQPTQLDLRSGEVQIDSINSVEDTKGNNGEKGSLSITNLRLIWICHRNSRINLSIGYNAVVSINIRTANSLVGVIYLEAFLFSYAARLTAFVESDDDLAPAFFEVERVRVALATEPKHRQGFTLKVL